MRPTFALIGCLAALASPLAAAPDAPAAKPAAPADAAALRQQVSAQAAEIADLRRRLAAQAAEIERLKQRLASVPDPVPSPAPSSPAPSSPARTPSASSTAAYDFAVAESYPAAVGAADNLLARDPADAEVLALKAYALTQYGSLDGARPLLVKALKATDGHTGRARALALVAQGALAAADGDTRAAAVAFQSAGNVDPTLGLTYLAYAGFLSRVGKTASARTLLQAALREKLSDTETAAVKRKLSAPPP